MRVLLLAAAVGLIALVSNITTEAQLSGQADTLLTVRLTLSRLVNSGTVWAGQLVLAGWLVARPGQSALAGLLAGEASLAIHYGVGELAGIYEHAIWAANLNWFLIALFAGPVLGLVGAIARRPTRAGLVARVLVPVAALIEPFFTGLLGPGGRFRNPDETASTLAGLALLTAGVVAITVLARRVSTAYRTRTEVSGPPASPSA